MSDQRNIKASLDEMVFETRDKDYGAYDLRKNQDKFLIRAAAIALLLFIIVTVTPKLIYMLSPKDDGDAAQFEKVVQVDIMDLPPPPDLEDVPPPPPPPDVPPPKLSSVEFKVPEPVDEDEVIEEDVIIEMDSIEKSNPGLETVEGDSVGYDFGEIEGIGDVVEEIEEPAPEPDPYAFIQAEKQPQPVNLDNIKKLIGYPKPAKDAEIEGQVVLRVLVDANGRYKKHIVVKNPHNILTKAVESQIHNLQFTPAIQAGEPIQLWVTIPFKFNLQR